MATNFLPSVRQQGLVRVQDVLGADDGRKHKRTLFQLAYGSVGALYSVTSERESRLLLC